MNYLELCQQVNLEVSGTSAVPLAVTGQSGRLANIVNWVAQEYRTIEMLSESWEFRQVTGIEKTLTTAAFSYSIASTFAITDLLKLDEEMLYLYDSSLGKSDKSKLEFFNYRTFMERFRDPAGSTGRPKFCTVDPSGNVLFDVTPDISTYVFLFDYVRKANTLTDDADEPAFAEEFHQVIVWRAVRRFGINSIAPEVMNMAQNEARLYMNKLKERYLPELEWEMVQPLA